MVSSSTKQNVCKYGEMKAAGCCGRLRLIDELDVTWWQYHERWCCPEPCRAGGREAWCSGREGDHELPSSCLEGATSRSAHTTRLGAGLWGRETGVTLHHSTHALGMTLITAPNTFFPILGSNFMGTWRFIGNLLLIEATEALYGIHQHEHQLMVGMPHLCPKLVPTVWQLRKITEKKSRKTCLFTKM